MQQRTPAHAVWPSEDIGSSQTLRAVLGLRGMVIEGHIRSGERVLEQRLVETLGVSRTPARAALRQVCEEGLLDHAPGGGYVVASFTMSDVLDSISIRGALEGMAARLAAERGASSLHILQMKRCVDDLDTVVAKLSGDFDITQFVHLNDRFHELLMQAANSPMLKRSIERLVVLPFAAPNAFVTATHPDHEGVHRILTHAQEEHRGIVEAIEQREGARAESLSKEHARAAWKYLRRIMETEDAAANFPGLGLIRKAS
jgi:GntR family transcriptional regulator, vanillate catabolism transcriptional regulator